MHMSYLRLFCVLPVGLRPSMLTLFLNYLRLEALYFYIPHGAFARTLHNPQENPL